MRVTEESDSADDEDKVDKESTVEAGSGREAKGRSTARVWKTDKTARWF